MKTAEEIIARYDQAPVFGGGHLSNYLNMKDLCCSTTAPDQDEIYYELIKGKEHLLHTWNQTDRRDQTKSGGLKLDIMGRSFDGTF